MVSRSGSRFLLIEYPYGRLLPVASSPRVAEAIDPSPGSAIVWLPGGVPDESECSRARERIPGLPLIVVLPPADQGPFTEGLLDAVESARPHSILPGGVAPSPGEIAALLRRPPSDLAEEVVERLERRIPILCPEIRGLLLRTLQLSSQVRSVSGLAKTLHLSRRALGRHFLGAGIPVPSHWLQMGRLLRVVVDLQGGGRTLLDAARARGYPDGFSLSNQMHRMTGVRPSLARERLGWEWFLERWFAREAASGALAVAGGVPVRGASNPALRYRRLARRAR